MKKRRIRHLRDKLPCRSLCEKLPKDLFVNTEYVWECPKDFRGGMCWFPISRIAAECYLSKENKIVPAPTVDELFEKFPAISTGELRIIPTYKRFVSHWELEASCPSWNSTTHVKGKTFADAVCKLYLSLRKEFKRGKKCIKQLF